MVQHMLTYERYASTLHETPPTGSGHFDFRPCPPESRPTLAAHMVSSHEVGSEGNLREKADEIAGKDLPSAYDALPPWHICRLVNTGASSSGSGSGSNVSGVLLRLHHCLGDGIALLSTLCGSFSETDGTPLQLDLAGKYIMYIYIYIYAWALSFF